MATLQHCHELRRRITRSATRALLREGAARPRIVASVPATAIHRVLVCRPNHRLGNLVLLTPLIKELARLLPTAEIDIVLAGEQGAAVFRGFHNVQDIHTLSRRMVRHPFGTARIAMQIRSAKYDLVIDPCETSQSSRWLTAIARATHVIDACGGSSRVDEPRLAGAPTAPKHMAQIPVHRLRQALAPPGDGSNEDFPAPDLQLSPAEQQRGEQILRGLTSAGASLQQVIGVFADARGAKRFTEAWWMRFIGALCVRVPGTTIVEIAPPDGRSRLSSRFPHFFSPDIREVAAVISRTACFISADCGVMHLGSASGTRTIGLFSVTDSDRYAPYGHGSGGIDTRGKSPEDVAQLAATIIEAPGGAPRPSADASRNGSSAGRAGASPRRRHAPEAPARG